MRRNPEALLPRFVTFDTDSKLNRYWLALSSGIVSNMLHKSQRVNRLLSVGMDVRTVQGEALQGAEG